MIYLKNLEHFFSFQTRPNAASYTVASHKLSVTLALTWDKCTDMLHHASVQPLETSLCVGIRRGYTDLLYIYTVSPWGDVTPWPDGLAVLSSLTGDGGSRSANQKPRNSTQDSSFRSQLLLKQLRTASHTNLRISVFRQAAPPSRVCIPNTNGWWNSVGWQTRTVSSVYCDMFGDVIGQIWYDYR